MNEATKAMVEQSRLRRNRLLSCADGGEITLDESAKESLVEAVLEEFSPCNPTNT